MNDENADTPAEHFLETRHGRVRYYRHEGVGTPVIFVNGGPGMPANPYRGRNYGIRNTMFMYDQSGTGGSDPAGNIDDYSLEYFVDELEDVITGLGLERFSLYGSSWGSSIVLGFMSGHLDDERIDRVILGSPLVSARIWNGDQQHNIAEMPDDIGRILMNGTDHVLTDDTYWDAYMEYMIRYMSPGMTKEEAWGFFDREISEIYGMLCGNSEIECGGKLKDIDLSGVLREIRNKTLVYCGDRDEVRVETASGFRKELPNGELAVIPGSGHHIEGFRVTILGNIINGFLDDGPR